MTSSTFSLSQKREKRGYSPPVGSCFLIRYVNRFSRKCRNTKTMVITVANQKIILQKAQGSSRRKSLQKPEWLSLSGLSFTFDWSRGKGEFLFPLKKLQRLAKQNESSPIIFSTLIWRFLYLVAVALYFLSPTSAQGVLLKGISWRQRGRWYGLNDGVGHCPSSSCPRPFWPMLYLSLASLKYF